MRPWKCYAATAVLIFPVMVSADPCPAPPSPFTDIATSDSFCTNAEWLKNRGITLGCVGTNYCPNDYVLRSQMALFMNRLGVTLSPSVTLTQGSSSSLEDLDTESFHCVSPMIAPASHPRRMTLTAHFSGLTAGAASYNLYFVYNTDGDATMFPLTSGIFMRVGTTGASWTHASNSTAINLAAATSYRFAIGVIRESGTADLSATRCALLQTLVNRNGTSSPFDDAPE